MYARSRLSRSYQTERSPGSLSVSSHVPMEGTGMERDRWYWIAARAVCLLLTVAGMFVVLAVVFKVALRLAGR